MNSCGGASRARSADSGTGKCCTLPTQPDPNYCGTVTNTCGSQTFTCPDNSACINNACCPLPACGNQCDTRAVELVRYRELRVRRQRRLHRKQLLHAEDLLVWLRQSVRRTARRRLWRHDPELLTLHGDRSGLRSQRNRRCRPVYLHAAHLCEGLPGALRASLPTAAAIRSTAIAPAPVQKCGGAGKAGYCRLHEPLVRRTLRPGGQRLRRQSVLRTMLTRKELRMKPLSRAFALLGLVTACGSDSNGNGGSGRGNVATATAAAATTLTPARRVSRRRQRERIGGRRAVVHRKRYGWVRCP